MEWPPERTELFPEDADNPAEREALQIVVDFEAVQARLAEFSIDDGTRAALRVFAELTDVSGFVSRLREDWRTRSERVSGGREGLRARRGVLGTFLAVRHWDFSPRWLNALTSAWLELIAAGVPADWLLAAANQLMDRSLALALRRSARRRAARCRHGARCQQGGSCSSAPFSAKPCGISRVAACPCRGIRRAQRTAESARQAIAVLDNAVAEGKPGEHVAVVVLRIEVGPVLLRMPARRFRGVF